MSKMNQSVKRYCSTMEGMKESSEFGFRNRVRAADSGLHTKIPEILRSTSPALDAAEFKNSRKRKFHSHLPINDRTPLTGATPGGAQNEK